MNRGEIFIFTALSVLLKKTLLDKWLERLTSWLFPTPFSTAPTLMYFYHISCEFRKTLETECSEFLSGMRWKTVKKISSRISYIFLQWMRWIAVNFFFTAFLVLLKKALLDKWLKRLTSWLFPTPFSTAPTLMYFYHISCEFRKTLETECSEFLSEMRWKAVKKIHRVFLTTFCSECGESRWIIYFHGILGIIKKGTSWQVVKTSHLLVVSNSLFHCANSHILSSNFL